MKNIKEKLDRIKDMIEAGQPYSIDTLIHELNWAVFAIEYLIDPPKVNEVNEIGENLCD